MATQERGATRRATSLLTSCCGLALLAATSLPASAGMPNGLLGLSVPSFRIEAQATAPDAAPAPNSAEQLKAAIDEIRARLARQREAQPAAPTAGLAEDLRAAGQRIAELTAAMEQLRAERDGVRQELVVAREQNEQLSFQAVELRRIARDAEATNAERLTGLEGRLRDLDAERSQATARAAALTAELDQARTAAMATAESLRTTEAAKAAAEASLDQEQAARATVEKTLRDEQVARVASEQALREAATAGASTAEAAQAAAAEANLALANREAGLNEAAVRIADLERALAERDAARNAVADDATRARADAQAAQAAVRAADERVKALTAQVGEAQAAAQAQAIEEQRSTNARLENEVRLAREEADAAARQRAQSMAADIEASRQRAQRLDTEIEALRAVATTSVSEVQSLGEQLIASLEENRQLTAALAEMRSSRETLDRELSAARRDAQNAGAEATGLRAELSSAMQKVAAMGQGGAGRGDTAADRAHQLALVKLQLSDDDAPAVADATAAAALLAELKAVETSDGWMMAIPEGLEFRPGSDQLNPDTTSGLTKLASLIKGYGAPAVRVVGHTDAEGDAEENRGLSQRRAQSVRDFLVGQFGLEPRLITTEGYGESRPIASNDNAAGRRLNRRVEVYVRR
jgi:outer membrane protein OmpA-like peptidoglycan-associated protein